MSYFTPQSYFQEEDLPTFENTIITNSLTNFITQADFLLHCKAQNNASMLGTVTGRPGVGKTVAIHYYVMLHTMQAPTLFPPCTMVRVPPSATAKSLAQAIYASFGQRANRRNSRHEILEDAAEVVLNNNTKLIFFDEAENLDTEGFEFLRYIFDITRCLMILVGSPDMLKALQKQGKFSDRVGCDQEFQAPSEAEILETILPQLKIPFWQFDPSSAKDLAMGKQLWQCTQPSFRSLCSVLNKASGLIGWEKKRRITDSILKSALYSSLRIPKQIPFNDEELEDEEEDHPDRTEAEERSETKKRAKRNKQPSQQTSANNDKLKDEEEDHPDRTEAEKRSEAKKNAKRNKQNNGEQS